MVRVQYIEGGLIWPFYDEYWFTHSGFATDLIVRWRPTLLELDEL